MDARLDQILLLGVQLTCVLSWARKKDDPGFIETREDGIAASNTFKVNLHLLTPTL